MTGSRALLSLLLFALALGSCSSRDAQRLRVGSKSFAEQRILAQALRELARRAEIGVAPVVDCGDTYGCRRALRSGAIDLMVEYTGTMLAYRGRDVPAGTSPLALLQKEDARWGLRWLPLLGFDNGYRLAVTTQRAAAKGLRTIADLARQPVGLRIACPRTYVGRPRDGLAPLLSRYGLELLGQPLLLDDPVERLHALASGRADVAVVYGTDGSLRTRGVTLLEDTLSFFPPYQAAVVVRESALRRLPRLRASLEQLSGRIDETTMRQANYGVQLEHRSVRRVAEQLLQKLGLITALRTGRRSSDLLLAVAASDALEGPTQRALRAIHVAFPDRPTRVLRLHRARPWWRSHAVVRTSRWSVPRRSSRAIAPVSIAGPASRWPPSWRGGCSISCAAARTKRPPAACSPVASASSLPAPRRGSCWRRCYARRGSAWRAAVSPPGSWPRCGPTSSTRP